MHTALDGVAASEIEVPADESARQVKAALTHDPRAFYGPALSAA